MSSKLVSTTYAISRAFVKNGTYQRNIKNLEKYVLEIKGEANF